MIALPSHSPVAATFALISALAIAACSACSSGGAKPAAQPAGQAPAPTAAEESQGASGAPPSSVVSKIDDTSGAALPANAKPMEATVDIKNTVRWSTASEVENFGYDVYRGESETGPFVRLTSKPIPGAGTSDEPHKYSYEDRDIDPTKDYWYYVESVSYSGVREHFTPVQKAKAKQPKL
ncbi:MAG TPA: hypothetical protein VGS22_14815 [Thermoanaerobaculia bacterium]|jgi:hypothetical protein|nr:hypothetical protein [Thermoanaerobaculia bacterium]